MRRQFDYTKISVRDGVEYKKPCINVVLDRDDGRPNACHSFEINALIDTGSDLCLFDWAIATYMNLNPKSVGKRTDIGAFAGTQNDVYLVHNVNIVLPQIEQSFPAVVGFGKFTGGIAGVLGHNGFLEHVSVTFSMGEHFEFIDEDPAPVIPLRPA